MLWHWRWCSRPTWLSAFGTITITSTITITIITISTITIITISPGLNVYAYTQNRLETGCRFQWENWVGDLLSPISNCLPLLQNLRLQLWTPEPWGIVRCCHGGCTKDKVQTTISTDVMISANIRHTPHATRHTPHAIRQTLPAIRHQLHAFRYLASATEQVSGSST